MEPVPPLDQLLRVIRSEQEGVPRELAEVLVDELVAFLAGRGLPADEEHGRRTIRAPLTVLDDDLLHDFVADHLMRHVSRPVSQLRKLVRLVREALLREAAAGRVDRRWANARCRALAAAATELPRLDRLARALRAHATQGRPDQRLFRQDREAYATAMRAWTANRPSAESEKEGSFLVMAVDEDRLILERRGPGAADEERIELELSAEVCALARAGDSLDLLVGLTSGSWFLIDAYSAGAPRSA